MSNVESLSDSRVEKTLQNSWKTPKHNQMDDFSAFIFDHKVIKSIVFRQGRFDRPVHSEVSR